MEDGKRVNLIKLVYCPPLCPSPSLPGLGQLSTFPPSAFTTQLLSIHPHMCALMSSLPMADTANHT